MQLALACCLLASCIDPGVNDYDDPEPWHLNLTIAAPVAFDELSISFPAGLADDTFTLATPTMTIKEDLAFYDKIDYVFVETTVGGKLYRASHQTAFMDEPNPMTDQTLHRDDASIVLELAR